MYILVKDAAHGGPTDLISELRLWGIEYSTFTECRMRTLGSCTCSLGECGCCPPKARPATWSIARSPTREEREGGRMRWGGVKEEGRKKNR